MITLFFLGSFIGSQALAKYSGLFSYDRAQLVTTMHSLQVLEDSVLRLTQQSSHPNSLQDIQMTSYTVPGQTYPVRLTGLEMPFNMPSFAWGCLLSGLGVAIVYNSTNDTEETRKAFMGCIVNGIFLTSIYIIRLMASY